MGYCFSPGFVVRVCYYYSVKIIWTAASSSQKLGENGLNQFFGQHQQFSSSMCKLESEEHHFLAWRLLSNCCRERKRDRYQNYLHFIIVITDLFLQMKSLKGIVAASRSFYSRFAFLIMAQDVMRFYPMS